LICPGHRRSTPICQGRSAGIRPRLLPVSGSVQWKVDESNTRTVGHFIGWCLAATAGMKSAIHSGTVRPRPTSTREPAASPTRYSNSADATAPRCGATWFSHSTHVSSAARVLLITPGNRWREPSGSTHRHCSFRGRRSVEPHPGLREQSNDRASTRRHHRSPAAPLDQGIRLTPSH